MGCVLLLSRSAPTDPARVYVHQQDAPQSNFPASLGLHHKRECLLAEYKANIDLWRHDDDLRQKRTAAFLTVYTIIVGILAFSARSQVHLGQTYLPVFLLVWGAFLGLAFCGFWFSIHKRNHKYIKFRRKQLSNIELKLGHMTTFSGQSTTLDNIEKREDKFHENAVLKKMMRFFFNLWIGNILSTEIENYFPLVLGFFLGGVDCWLRNYCFEIDSRSAQVCPTDHY